MKKKYDIYVIGKSRSGKTTLCSNIEKETGIAFFKECPITQFFSENDVYIKQQCIIQYWRVCEDIAIISPKNSSVIYDGGILLELIYEVFYKIKNIDCIIDIFKKWKNNDRKTWIIYLDYSFHNEIQRNENTFYNMNGNEIDEIIQNVLRKMINFNIFICKSYDEAFKTILSLLS